MADWHDARLRQAALTPTDNRPPDGNVYCYRPGGELYVVVPRSQWKSLREKGKLDSFLSAQRKSGAVIPCGQDQWSAPREVQQ